MKQYSNIVFTTLLLGLSTSLASCHVQKDKLYKTLSQGEAKIEEYPGHYKDSTKKAKNTKKTDNVNPEIGIASWYGVKHQNKKAKSLHGKKTANGDMFNTDALTAAHKTLPIPSIAKITNLSNNKSVIVMINDRGPYAKGRIVDVSSKVAAHLDFKNKGTAKVKLEPLAKETLALLDKLSLESKHGSKPHGKIKEPKCTINCFVKLLNLKNGHNIN
ncbi:MAG: septal ring lytic transglycosylase RlpA family protein [Rickettsiaceae bacterium]|nr:septal ring lytic transglycosylase RlpA family protein [Rickettsiaceae bacterium]